MSSAIAQALAQRCLRSYSKECLSQALPAAPEMHTEVAWCSAERSSGSKGGRLLFLGFSRFHHFSQTLQLCLSQQFSSSTGRKT